MRLTTGRTPYSGQQWLGIASPELTAALLAIGTRKRLGDKQLLYAQGEMGTDLYGIQKGWIRVVSTAADGYEGLIALYPPGAFFGEVSLFDERPRPVSTYAIGPTELIVVPAVQLRELLDRNPIWYRDFARVLAFKLRLALGHIDATMLPTGVRLAMRLLDLARAYGQPGMEGLVIDLHLSQDDLARMLGLTRQSVNKELRAMENRGWIRLRRGEITLNQVAALEDYVAAAGGETIE